MAEVHLGRRNTLQIYLGEDEANSMASGILSESVVNEIYRELRRIEKPRTKKQGQKTPLSFLQESMNIVKKVLGEVDIELPVREVYVEPPTSARLTEKDVRASINKTREQYARLVDRWETYGYAFVGVDLAIDTSAVATGAYRYFTTGKWEEGLLVFGGMAFVGAALLATSYGLKHTKEVPYKRKAVYLSHLARTPINVRRGRS